MIHILQLVFATIFILFLPGFVVSFVFFKLGEIELIERLALSFALSVAVVPLIAFYTNRSGIKITSASISLEILGIMIISGLIIWIQYLWKKPPKV